MAFNTGDLTYIILAFFCWTFSFTEICLGHTLHVITQQHTNKFGPLFFFIIIVLQLSPYQFQYLLFSLIFFSLTLDKFLGNIKTIISFFFFSNKKWDTGACIKSPGRNSLTVGRRHQMLSIVCKWLKVMMFHFTSTLEVPSCNKGKLLWP